MKRLRRSSKNSSPLLFIIVSILSIFIMPSPAFASSDDGLHISVNDFDLQVRIGLEDDFFELYAKEKLYIDFFNIISFIKQNYDRVKDIDKDITLRLERDRKSKALTVSRWKGEKLIEVKREDHITLCNILIDELKEIGLGFTIFYEYKDLSNDDAESEIYIGAIPGTYQLYINDRLVIIAPRFKELPEKKYYKDGKLLRENKTVRVTIGNFDTYLAGYLTTD
jgi:hypothetical protein